MIDELKDKNYIRELIELTARLFELLNNLSLIKYAKFILIMKITIKNLCELLKNQIDQ